MLAGYAAFALLVAPSNGGRHSPSAAGAIVKLVAAALLVLLGVHGLRAPQKAPKPERVPRHPEELLPAVGPPLVVTLMGPRGTAAPERLDGFFARHQRGISAAICFGFAALLTLAGLNVLLEATGQRLGVG